MALEALDVLAGPIVRRVQPDLVSVWIALRKPASVRLEVYRGLGVAGRAADRIAAKFIPPGSSTRGNHTLQVGRNLHVALAIMEPIAPTQLEWGQVFAYDLRMQESAGPEVGFAELGLLQDGAVVGVDGRPRPHLALGYIPGHLPSFVLPAGTSLDLKIAHGSCRLPTAAGKDTMPELDGLLQAHLGDTERLQMLFLTGDQIYADEPGVETGRILSQIAQDLFGESVEEITVQLDRLNAPAGTDFPVDRLHFPIGRRTHLLHRAGFTSDNMSAHVMSIGEYCALYLTMWSNAHWPDLQPLLAARWPLVNDYRERRKTIRAKLKASNRNVSKPISQRAPYYDAWRFLPDEDRAIDVYLTQADRDDAWNDHQPAVWGPFMQNVAAEFVPTPPAGVGNPPAGVDADRAAKRRQLATFLTPSWFAGQQHLGVEIGDGDEAPIRADQVRDRLHAMTYFVEGLPRVRRALANVATYMMFDDHEVTDDWNLNIRKARSLRDDPLARNIARNALIAYTLFQGWGNDPREFAREDSNANKVLKEIAGLFFDDAVPRTIGPRQPATDALERLFDLVRTLDPVPNAERIRWDYKYEGSGFEVLSLDTRTWRSFERDADPSVGEPFTELANAALMSTEGMQVQIPAEPPAGVGAIPDPASGGFTIVISPAPVFGYPPVESLFQPILNMADMAKMPSDKTFGKLIDAYKNIGRPNRDPEPWGFVPRAFEALLARLRNRRRVIFLSGDVHYGCTLAMSYWTQLQATTPETSRFIQLTASAFLKEQDITITEYFSMDLAQQLGQALAKDIERFGWVKGLTGTPEGANPVEEPPDAEFNARVKYLMQIDPILLAPQALPPDTVIRRQPDWAWRLNLVVDERPDSVRLQGLNPPPLLPISAGFAQMTKSVADRHRWQAEHAPDRSWIWFANFGVVDFFVENEAASLRHSLYSFDLAGEGAAAHAYTIVTVPLDVPEDEELPKIPPKPPPEPPPEPPS